MKTVTIIESDDSTNLAAYIDKLLEIPNNRIVLVSPIFRLTKEVVHQLTTKPVRFDIDKCTIKLVNGSELFATNIGDGSKARGFRPNVLAMFYACDIPKELKQSIINGII
jgi:hypothetical protein